MEVRMDDRAMLEFAAKAAGYSIAWIGEKAYIGDGVKREWNPRDYDGDALRLAVKCGMKIEINNGRMEPFTRVIIKPNICKEEEHRDDPNRATRRAITRVAAALGNEKDQS
jgi:hypothetical protein